MKKHFTSFILIIALAITMVPMTGTIAYAANSSSPAVIDVSDSSGTNLPAGVSYGGNKFTIGIGASGSSITVIGTTTQNVIIVTDSAIVTLVLSGASITAPGGSLYSPIDLQGSANVTLQLADGATNTMSAADANNRAGIDTASSGGISATLTVTGSGTLNALGGAAAAGVGGGSADTGGIINIIGGTVNATGKIGGSGIGGGVNGDGGNITINGGIVTATCSSTNGAGIGGGNGGEGGNITINGGTVTATGNWFGAGIGGGINGDGGNITISGGTVTAIGGANSGSGIGGGDGGAGGDITISGNANVTATGGDAGAGIGGGGAGAGGNITISGSAIVTAIGGDGVAGSRGGAGIGGGGISSGVPSGASGNINISASTVVTAVSTGLVKSAIDAAGGGGSVINAKLDNAISAVSDTYLKSSGNVLKLSANYKCFAFSAAAAAPINAWSDPACTAIVAGIVTTPGGIANIPLSTTIGAIPTPVTTGSAYILTVNLDGGNGSAVSGPYASGAAVSIAAGTKSGYTFGSWTSSNGGAFGNVNSAATTFTMPGNTTTITAVWTLNNTGGGGGSRTAPGTNITIDGEKFTIGDENKNGDGTTVTVDQNKLTDGIAKASDNSGVIIPITGSTNATAQLVVKNIEEMAKKDMTLTVQTGKISYSINTSTIDISKITASLGMADTSKIPFNVHISNSNAVVNDATVVVSPVEFAITATYNGKTANVDKFSNFVDRTIEITSEQAKKISTAVVVEPNGILRHVPTKVTVVDGKYYAVINSLTNSTYTVIWNPVEFSDVAAHWAKNTINDMGSRMVISGVGQGNFEPDRDITRAEFAAIVIRALGLAPGDGTSSFADVSTGAWFCGYVKTASEQGIITGYDAATFGPNDKITREQAMTMISRAMKITGLKSEINDSEINALIANYADGTAAADYAKTSVAACLKTGVITGRSGGTIAPKESITRAEVAVIVQRLLQKSDLI